MFDLFRSRDKAVRILLGVILGVVAISMVTYLIPGAGGGMQAGTDDNVIAKIGDEKLTTTTALAAVQNMMQGRQIPATMMGYFAPQVVESLINERAQAYEAKRLGIEVSDDEVAAAIHKQLPLAFLNKDGSVNQDAVGQALSQKNLTIPQWIEETRESIMAERLRALVEASVVVTKADLQGEYKQRNEKVKIDYVLVKPAMLEQEVQVAPGDVDAYFKAHRQMYQTPEKRSLAIILLDPAKVQATINPSDADLLSVYNSSLDRFRTPEQVQVRHILIPIDATTPDAVAQAKAADVLKQLKAGGDFGELAKKYSKDPGSGPKGGELGMVSKGQMVKPFEDAAFSTKVGDLSGLVKTTYGYHILQVEAKSEARVKPFAEVKDVLAAEYKKRKSADAMQQLADKAGADLKKDPTHPDKAATDTGGELIRADNVSAGAPLPQIGVSQELQTAINGLKAGGVTPPVTVQVNKVAVAEVTGDVAAHQANLDDVRAQVEAAVRKEKLDALVQKRVNDLKAKVKADNGDLAQAAKDMGLEMKESNDFNRQGAVEGLGAANSLADAFGAKDGALLGPLNVAGGSAVVKVVAHTAADMSGYGAQEATLRTEMKSKISQERERLFAEGVRKRLEKEGKVKVQQDALNRLLQGLKG